RPLATSCRRVSRRTPHGGSDPLSLHDALPIFQGECKGGNPCSGVQCLPGFTCDESDGLCKCGGRLCGEDETCMLFTVEGETRYQDRKSTRLNSSHVKSSYAVVCLKKKKQDTPV